jgi:transcriptional regulator with XRE-family HTH domain
MPIVLRADAILRALANRGLSKTALANLTGLSAPTITAATAGRAVSPMTAQLIARALDAAPPISGLEDLLALDESKNP